VVSLDAERPGAVELSVALDDAPGDHASAVAYPELVGRVLPGDRVLLNTTAVALGLGTGGLHFVVAVDRPEPVEVVGRGRTMKLRYTPAQVAVLAAEEQESPHHDALRDADDLHGLPVVWIPLHSMLGPVAAGARAAGASRVAYVMTDGAALPSGLSRQIHQLRTAGILDGVVTAGQAFGGDIEAVTAFSGMLAARCILDADVLVVGDGPGNTGTDSPWGTTALQSAHSLNAAAILGGRPVAALRISFADRRQRHVGVSHHSMTALSRVALVPAHVAVPVLPDGERRDLVWSTLREAKLDERHQLVEANGQPGLDLLRRHGVEPTSMGRGREDDPEFFLAAASAGVLAGRMAAGSRAWRDDYSM